jgi:hypothetical protein
MADKTGLGVAEIVGNLRDPILRLAAQHGAMNVRVFGSVARGEAMPDSDLDLLVRWDYGRMSAWGGAELDAELEALLGRRVDVVSENGLHPALRETILREAVPL